MKRKKIVKFAAWGIVAALVAWGVSAIAVYWVSAGRVFDKPSDVPHCRAAVVLGCRKALPNGLLNLYFTRRIAAAAEETELEALASAVAQAEGEASFVPILTQRPEGYEGSCILREGE